MSKKHMALYLVIGWAIAYVFPPQRVVGYFRKS